MARAESIYVVADIHGSDWDSDRRTGLGGRHAGVGRTEIERQLMNLGVQIDRDKPPVIGTYGSRVETLDLSPRPGVS